MTRPHRGVGFWVTAAVGWALVGWGVRGALHHRIDTRPAQLARFFFGGIAAHDLLLAPALLAGGFVVSRAVPGRWRAPVQAALVISGCAALFAWPEVRDYARILHNPSSLPRNYTANLAALVAVVAVVVIGGARARGRRTG